MTAPDIHSDESKIHLKPLLLTSIVAGGILAILAPYGTSSQTLFYRCAFWIGLCIAGGLGAGFANKILERQRPGAQPWQRIAAQSLGATVCVWLCFLGLTVLTHGLPPASFYYLIPFYIAVIAVVICGFGELLRNRKAVAEPIHTDAALRARLKPALRRAEIYALSADDHYVRVHTSEGDDLILMRLSDAIKDAGSLAGLSTHRSWWVAEAGVKSARKSSGKIMLVLHNGIEVPVSRNNVKIVKEAGWV